MDEKYAISLISGDYKMRTPPDVNLWCISNDCKPCAVVEPRSTWERINSIITLTYRKVGDVGSERALCLLLRENMT
jgi:hypothetical protein